MIGMAVREYGEPLQRLELPDPELRPGHALLEVLTCGVCYSDVKTSRGRMPFSDRLPLPHVPGHEICARVVASDPPVMEPGTTVVVNHLWPCRRCARCRAGVEQQCTNPQGWTGFMSPGGFEERLTVPIDRLTRVPAEIDPVHAAPLTCAVGTSYRAVATRGRVTPGSLVVVIGLGGVGIHALQIAHAAGGRVTGLDVSPRALEVAGSLGLDALQGEDPASEERISRLSDGGGVDVVIDTVGSEATLAQAFRLVRAGGRIVGVGYAVDSNIVLPTARFVLEEVELVGSRYVALDELERAIALVAEGRVQTVVDRVLPLAEVNQALEALEAGDVVGRVVLDVAGVCGAGRTEATGAAGA
jgi:D-arabinose 1-dehydrogenase-like Zn-dependent alcohol dehydrogenase